MSALPPKERRRKKKKRERRWAHTQNASDAFLKKSQKRQLVPKNVKSKGKLHWEGNIFFSFFSVPIYAAEFDLTFGIPPVLICTRKRKRRNFLFSIKGESCAKSESLFFFRLGCWGKERVVDEKFLSSQVCCLFRGGSALSEGQGEKREKRRGNGASFAVKSVMLFLGLRIQQMF